MQLYERRYKVTCAGEEREKFGTLTQEYMSEESSPDEEDNMKVHKPSWQSDSRLSSSLER
jgi:hypothetical protein